MPQGADRRRYRILDTLGEGGFGKVYRAEMQGMGGFTQQIALKVVNPAQPHAEEALRRLRDEARMLGLIRHRAVVKVYGLTRLELGWAVALEYVDGVDCTAIIKGADIPLRVTVEIAEEVASALQAAWEATTADGTRLELIHRDIKPANIRIAPDGVVKVLDFGAARGQFGERESNTRSYVLGSYRYMAPERFHGQDSPAVDVYALGLVMIEMMTGKETSGQPMGALEHRQHVADWMIAVRERLGEEAPEFVSAMASLASLVEAMVSFDPAVRPTAPVVVERCRTLRGLLEGPALRDWATVHVPRVQGAETRVTPDAWSGSILLELNADGSRTEAKQRPMAVPAPRQESRGAGPWILATVGVAGVFAVVLGVLAIVFVVVRGRAPEAGPPAPIAVEVPGPPDVPADVPAAVGLAVEPVVAPVPEPVPEPVVTPVARAAHTKAPVEVAAVAVPVAPEPEPPVAVAPAVATTVRVEVSGGAREVWLQAGTIRERLPASVEPGSYSVLAAFGEDPLEKRTSVEVARASTVDCIAEFRKCRLR